MFYSNSKTINGVYHGSVESNDNFITLFKWSLGGLSFYATKNKYSHRNAVAGFKIKWKNMSRRSGVIYDLGDERYGVAYSDKQLAPIVAKGKVHLTLFWNRKCTSPILDKGKHQEILKSPDKIKLIGFIN